MTAGVAQEEQPSKGRNQTVVHAKHVYVGLPNDLPDALKIASPASPSIASCRLG